MCDPFNLFASMAAGGKLVEGAAGYGSHSQAANLAEGNAELLRTQAEIAKGNADLAITRGNYDEFLSRRKTGHVLSAESAHFAGGHVDPTFGSPLVIQGYSAAQGETDAQLIRARAMTERADALTGAANISGQSAAQLYKASAESGAALVAALTAPINAGTAFLTTKSMWKGLDRAGGSGGSGYQIDMTNPFLLNQPKSL